MTFKTGEWGIQARKRSKNRKHYFNGREHELRLFTIKLLGDKCSRCGFTDIRALQIDHVNGDGGKERKLPGGRYSRIIKSLENGENKYQVLCANCNWIKRYENGEHPKRAG